ncbi:MAG TPA: archaellin/type IV pilin N-terminal domain-containing protein [archaeon]|nr:archaellin/type IV pilin N-terminal domain-containing protein [archaeon]
MKGISPLIASVLLIAFTVSIATLVSGWFSTLTRSTTTTVSNKTSESISCSNAQISIEDVYISAGSVATGSARVIVKNNGYTTIGVNGLQIYNTTGQNFSSGFSPVSTFDAGAIQTFSIVNVSVISCPSTFSKVIVTSNCGGITDTFDGAPKCQ